MPSQLLMVTTPEDELEDELLELEEEVLLLEDELLELLPEEESLPVVQLEGSIDFTAC
tara:strand:+ start:579 stop:752 length:174 start_codon:yes stop_codon:yes gene_type:complete